MSENIKEQLNENVKARRYYALQLYESTDIWNDDNLLEFVRYDHDKSIWSFRQLFVDSKC